MLKIAVCDDEVEMLELLTGYIRCAGEDFNEQIEVDCYSDSTALCRRLSGNMNIYDLIFLDIMMPEKDGVNVGRFIRKELKDNITQIAYVSSESKYAMDLFQLHPLDFIIKPVDYDSIKKVVRLADELSLGNRHVFSYEKNRGNFREQIGNIIYFESKARKLVMHTVRGTHEFYGRIDDVYEELKPYNFLAIHKSFLVNYTYISMIQYENVLLLDGTNLPVSRAGREELKNIWGTFM